MISSKQTSILFFIALCQLSPLQSMQYVKGMAYKIIPDTYQLSPETLKTADKLSEDIRTSATVISGSVTESTKNLSGAITSSTNIVGQTVTTATERICTTVDSGVQSFEKTAAHLMQTTEKTSGDLIKSIDTLNGTANKFIEKGVQISIDQKTTDTLSQAVTTLKPIADNGLQVKVDDQTAKALQDLSTNGLKTNFSIDPRTIVTSFTALGGLTLVAVGALLIFKELTKSEDINCKASSEEVSWKNSLKNIVKNRYVIGTTGILSGLLLIGNSNRIATACV